VQKKGKRKISRRGGGEKQELDLVLNNVDYLIEKKKGVVL